MRRWASPLGEFDLAVGLHGVSAVRLPVDENLPSVEDELAHRLDQHIRGNPARLKLDFQGLRPLAQVTLAKLLEIPYGEVRSYSWVAREIGRSTAVRSVATVVSANPVPILVPCHRVVQSDGSWGDFSLGGADMRRRTLDLEGADLEALEKYATEGVRYLSDEASGIFHLPSCGRARKTAGLGRLASAEEAQQARLDPCRTCRPV